MSWTIRGIDPATRYAAEAAADAEGLALGAWLDRAILRHGDGFVPPATRPRDAATGDDADNDSDDDAFADPAVHAAIQDALGAVEHRLAARQDNIVRLVTPLRVQLDALETAAADRGLVPPPRRSRPLGWLAGAFLAAAALGAVGMAWLWHIQDIQPPPPDHARLDHARPDHARDDGARRGAEAPRAPERADAAPSPPVAPRAPGTETAAPADETPLQRLQAEAAAGRPEAQHDLALLYAAGGVVPRDERAAAGWFEKAAIQGLANAQYNLGVLHDQGRGVARDAALAYFWYHAAADQHHPQAQYNLGVAHAEGRGIAQDYVIAAVWFRRAAERGVIEAQYNLGLIHENGLGVARDVMTAYAWYRRAAGAGHAQALARMAQLEGRPFRSSEWEPPAPAATTAAPRPAALSASEIRDLQALLARLDFAVGQPDGRLGPATRAAIRDFQQMSGLAVTGEPSAELLRELREVVGATGR